jgi:hypothetical protein
VSTVKLLASPVTLLSLVLTSPETALFSATVLLSLVAVIGSGVTVRETVAVDVWPEALVTV